MATTTNDLSTIAAAQKDALIQREKQSAQQIITAFGVVYQKIQQLSAELQALIREQFAGSPVPAQFLNEQDRLETLRREIERALRLFSQVATARIATDQRDAIQLGATDAKNLLRAVDLTAPPRAIIPASEQLALLVGSAGDGSPLSQLFERMSPRVAAVVAEELITGVAEQAAPRVIAARIRERSGMALQRSLLIARQETLRVYRAATLETYRAITGVLSWRWLAALDPRTCALCWAMDGREFPLTVKFTSHVGCRCSMVPVAESTPRARTGPEAFAELESGVQQQILGPVKFKLFKSGQLTLDQVVGVRFSPQWGVVRYERSASEILRA